MRCYVKYLIGNLKSFILDSHFVAVMMLVNVVTAAIIINFSYGLYQNFNIIIERGAEGSDTMNIFFVNSGMNEGEYVSKKEFMDCIYEIAEYEETLEEKCVVFAADGIVEGDKYDFSFNIKNGKLGISETLVKNLRNNGMLTRGSYWSDMDEREGNYVALCYDKTRFDNDAPVLDRIQADENTLIIDGKEYQILGYQIWTSDGAMIPITSVDDSVCMENLSIIFDRGITRDTFNRISETFVNALGNRVYILDIPVIDKDSLYTYRTVILIALLIALIAGLDFVILYRYITDKRSKRVAIYRLCGMRRGKLVAICFSECMILTIPLYLLGMVIFAKSILPGLSRYFPYMEPSYSTKLYLLLFFLYIGVSAVMCLCMILHDSRRTIIDRLKH